MALLQQGWFQAKSAIAMYTVDKSFRKQRLLTVSSRSFQQMYKKKFSLSNVELEFQEEVKSQVSIIVFDKIFWQ